MKYDSPTILMCPPDYYGIEYEINPWMSRSQQSDLEVARQQWESLHALLQKLGARIELMTPVKGLPDLVFTANAGLIWKHRVFLSLFRHEARQGETAVDRDWFQQAGLETIEMPEDYFFEGAGDALFCGDTLFAGYLIRSDVKAMQWVAAEMNCRVIPLQLVDEFYYHLDTCFCPLSETEAIYYPPAFDSYAQQALLEHIPHLIPVVDAEAQRFACNAVVIGKSVALNTGCPVLEQALLERGYTPHSTPLDEFIKAGGSAKCLTLRLDGECAAVWP
ncbi:N(G),N(G)-dimethylarginine dimethylaminohydrolase [Gimesia panareensis]|uniref:N(G),N(G)-dimethylarginine dimethylaminohydrolase n=1 Tax=Gimesia panareensis TaxID=2527978 RepID=A0A518FUT4_9PLAN|nr:arginine deiminase-related protein [Gimesia panareensis]QDV20045.1 N(G),N(G)-dimethylarginine dimethylaminohydrolase [Gimesia panareensis]